jgi:hypothetical protein
MNAYTRLDEDTKLTSKRTDAKRYLISYLVPRELEMSNRTYKRT